MQIHLIYLRRILLTVRLSKRPVCTNLHKIQGVSALSPNCSYVEEGILHFLEFGNSRLLQMRNLHYESRQVPEGLKFRC